MRRLIQFVLLVIFVTASTTGIRASTDCERWFIAYKQQLAHAKSIQRIEAARRRARMYAKRKLAGYVKPTTPVHPHPHRRPMSREETLRHFNLACGVLPEESADLPLIAEEKPPAFEPFEPASDFLEPDDGDQEIASYVAPPYVPPNFGPPSESGPPLYSPPIGGTGGGPGPHIPNNPPPNNPPPNNPPPVVPEPGSLVLVLTGTIAAAGAVRRKFRG